MTPTDVLDVGPLVVALEAGASVVSVAAAARLYAVYRLLGERSLLLASLSFALLAASFALELAGNAWSLAGHHGVVRGGRPEEIVLLLANRGVMLASPVYIAAYTLYAVSVYLEHVPVEEHRAAGAAAMAPLLLEVYVDNNLVALAILLAAGYLVATRGGARIPWLAFFALLVAGHALLVAAGLLADPGLMAAGLAARAAAPIAYAVLLSRW